MSILDVKGSIGMKPQDLFDRLAAGYEYDPMYGALCNERNQLKVENVKLRKENDTLMRRIDELCMENEKLRELVSKVEHYERMGCNECPHDGSCDANTFYDEDCVISCEIEREKSELELR